MGIGDGSWINHVGGFDNVNAYDVDEGGTSASLLILIT